MLWAGALLNRLGGFVFPFLALYLTEVRHFGVAQTGTVVALCGLGTFLAGPIGGTLADRFGRRPTMIAGLLLGPCSLLVLGAAREPAHIAIAAFAFGLLGDLYRPVNQAMMADLVPPEDRARAFGILYWAINLGFSAASIIGGVMARRNFAALFIADAVTTLGFALIVFLAVPETRPASVRRASSSAIEDLFAPMFDVRMMAFALLAFVTGTIFMQVHVTLPIDMLAHGVSADAYGWMLSINGLLIVVLTPFLIGWLPKLRRDVVLATAALLVGAGFGGNALAHTVPAYIAGIVIWTLGEILQSSAMPAVVAEIAPAHRRGVYQGWWMMAWGAATFVAPLVGSRVLGTFGAPALWGGCFALGILCAAGHLLFEGLRAVRGASAQLMTKELRDRGGVPAESALCADDTSASSLSLSSS